MYRNLTTKNEVTVPKLTWWYKLSTQFSASYSYCGLVRGIVVVCANQMTFKTGSFALFLLGFWKQVWIPLLSELVNTPWLGQTSSQWACWKTICPQAAYFINIWSKNIKWCIPEICSSLKWKVKKGKSHSICFLRHLLLNCNMWNLTNRTLDMTKLNTWWIFLQWA